MRACNDSVSLPDRESIAAAARALSRGGIVVYPTETFYGLGVDALNAAALQRLVELKGREPGKPIALLVSDLDMVRTLVTDIPPQAEALMGRFWPGPLTIVLAARAGASAVLTGAGGGIGVRLSSHPLATSLVRALGRPVTAPSANPAGLRPPTRIEEARDYFGAAVDVYIDGGTLRGTPASTVVDARGALRIIREGAVAADALRAGVAQLV